MKHKEIQTRQTDQIQTYHPNFSRYLAKMHTGNQNIHQFQHLVEASYHSHLLHATLLVSGTDKSPFQCQQWQKKKFKQDEELQIMLRVKTQKFICFLVERSHIIWHWLFKTRKIYSLPLALTKRSIL